MTLQSAPVPAASPDQAAKAVSTAIALRGVSRIFGGLLGRGHPAAAAAPGGSAQLALLGKLAQRDGDAAGVAAAVAGGGIARLGSVAA